MNRFVLLLVLVPALAWCKPKTDATSDGGAASGTTPAVSASASVADPTPDKGATPQVPVAVGAAAITDPGAAPSQEATDKAAQAQINKANYKTELGKLEKEDLSQDKK